LDFNCTNNIAEYEALFLGLRKLKAMGIRRAILKSDSQVISGHVDNSSKARDPKLDKISRCSPKDGSLFRMFLCKKHPERRKQKCRFVR
jgi:ribonuclease HI